LPCRPEKSQFYGWSGWTDSRFASKTDERSRYGHALPVRSVTCAPLSHLLSPSCQGSHDYLLANRRPLLIGRAVLREVVASWKAEVKI
jgi:hypothetical protein